MRYLIVTLLVFGFLTSCVDENDKGYHPDAKALQIEALKVYHRKPDSALSLLNNAVRMDPSFYLAYNTKAMVYMSNEEWERAVAELLKSIHWEPNQAEVYLQLGMVNDKLNMPEKSSAFYEQAIAVYDTRLAEGDPYEVQDRANRALAFIMKGETEKGNNILDGLFEKHPDNAFLKDLQRRKREKPDSLLADKNFYMDSLLGLEKK